MALSHVGAMLTPGNPASSLCGSTVQNRYSDKAAPSQELASGFEGLSNHECSSKQESRCFCPSAGSSGCVCAALAGWSCSAGCALAGSGDVKVDVLSIGGPWEDEVVFLTADEKYQYIVSRLNGFGEGASVGLQETVSVAKVSNETKKPQPPRAPHTKGVCEIGAVSWSGC